MKVEQWLGADNQLGIDIWHGKYQNGDESFDEWLDRVSGGNPAIKDLITAKKFLFGGRILANRGLAKNGRKLTYSNCYVLSAPEDNIESIFDTAKKLARTYSYGGGVGINIGKLSPRGAAINNAAKETSGAVSFMDLYSMVTGLIGQSGRRGALMISIPCDHPDLEEFIDIKNDLDKVTKANISVMITDDFMEAVQKREVYPLSFTRDETGESIVKEVDAYELFHKLCYNNWNMAEPGMLFWDRIENWNLVSNDPDFHYAGTNPCAEEPLPAGGSCLLGSMNLAEFVDENGQFDFPAFGDAVGIAVVGLNEVLDEGLPLHPLQEQRDSVRDWRQIGLGIFGLGDMLIKAGLQYGSPESIELCDKIGAVLADKALQQSAYLANKYKPYPNYNPEFVLASPWLNENTSYDTNYLINEYGLYNSQLLTCAPTGTLSTMLGVSGGIEPIFANYYTRKTESLKGHDEYYKVYTPIVREYMDSNGITDDNDLPDYFITAPDIPYENRIKMQAVWQKHIDASISSTINLPNSATVEDVEDIYMKAWENGLKGVTIFRDGCARVGILTTEPEPEQSDDAPIEIYQNTLPRGFILNADDNCIGKKRTLRTGCGTLHCEAFFDPDTGDLLETYFSRGSTGGCANSYTGLSRMISLAARGGVDVYSIVDQLKSSGVCPAYAVRSATHHDTSKGSSCPVAIGNALIDMYEELQAELYDDDKEVDSDNIDDGVVASKCPQCGGKLTHQGGCDLCLDCAWSKCD